MPFKRERKNPPSSKVLLGILESNLFYFIVDKGHHLDLLLTDKRLRFHTKKTQQKPVFYLINGTHFPKSHHNGSIPLRFTSHLTSEKTTSSFAPSLQHFLLFKGTALNIATTQRLSGEFNFISRLLQS